MVSPYAALADIPSKATATQLKGRELDQGGGGGTRRRDLLQRPMEFPRPRFDQAQRGLTPSEVGTAVHTVMQLIRLERRTPPGGWRRRSPGWRPSRA